MIRKLRMQRNQIRRLKARSAKEGCQSDEKNMEKWQR